MEIFYKSTEVSIENGILDTYVFFKVPTDIGDKFMRISIAEKDSFVVVVDAQKFLSLWRNTTDTNHIDIANGNPSIWKNDRKFSEAKDGFVEGEINPVPLARVYCNLAVGKKPYVNIENGVTRTIYLLVANAKNFPVECTGENALKSAELLNELAGVLNGKVKLVNDLILENK